jgi:hypothetical protein
MARFFRDMMQGKHKDQIQKTIEYYVEFEGFSLERAEELANKDYQRAKISAFNTLGGLGLANLLFKYGLTGLIQNLFGYDGDDDEDNEKRILPFYAEYILNAIGGVALEGLPGGSQMTDTINQIIQVKGGHDIELFGLLKPATEGINNIVSGIKYFADEDKDNAEAWYKIIQGIASAYPKPLDATTASKMIVGIKDMFTNAPNKDEFWIGFLNFMNLPTSQMANVLQGVEGYASNKDASEDPRYINAYNWAKKLRENIFD